MAIDSRPDDGSIALVRRTVKPSITDRSAAAYLDNTPATRLYALRPTTPAWRRLAPGTVMTVLAAALLGVGGCVITGGFDALTAGMMLVVCATGLSSMKTLLLAGPRDFGALIGMLGVVAIPVVSLGSAGLPLTAVGGAILAAGAIVSGCSWLRAAGSRRLMLRLLGSVLVLLGARAIIG